MLKMIFFMLFLLPVCFMSNIYSMVNLYHFIIFNKIYFFL